MSSQRIFVSNLAPMSEEDQCFMNDIFGIPSVGTWKIYSYLGSHVDVGIQRNEGVYY